MAIFTTRRFALCLSAIAGICSAQNCPLLGPAYPALTDPLSSAVLQDAKSVFNSSLAQAFAAGLINSKTATFSYQVFSTDADTPVYEYYYSGGGSSVDANTLYRIGSISKLLTVYSILAKLGDQYWDEPVTKYVPELADANGSDAVDDVDWSEVTLGALASQMSGIGRDCKYDPR